ncbi:MAG: NAD(+) synthase [Ruminococcaceae bacterium]|nr:NAD(+) synthase [Oscillospiraceae bacterium]
MNQYGFIKIATAVPQVQVANTEFNAKECLALVKEAESQGADIILFPELSLTAYSCADLFLQKTLLEGSEQALSTLLTETKNFNLVIIIGLPVSTDLHLFNAAAVLQKGKICGIVPKSCIANYSEFSEGRWFQPASASTSSNITLCGTSVPFGQMIFTNNQTAFSVEICEDLWASDAPSSSLTLQGAEIMLNLSATNAVIGKRNYRRMLVQNRSFVSHCAYVFTSSGPGESTTDTVYAGHTVVAENGIVLLDEQEMKFESALYYTDIDIERLQADRKRMNTYMSQSPAKNVPTVSIEPFSVSDMPVNRKISPQPFVPKDKEERNQRFAEIYQTLSIALAKRLMHAHAKTAVIGISGGLDSTLALLITSRAMEILERPSTDIIAVTMPGFGTTGRTLQNAKKLMNLLGTTTREISIREACIQHFKDIGHDPNNTDVTYENTQARERTQILMDIANQSGGLVIGTGDLSELALGWATYAGDHISMYGVNAGVPKTLIRHLVDWIGYTLNNSQIQSVLADVLETPVSPELLPMDDTGSIAQKTEEILGEYILHDFFLYYFLRYGFTKEKILYLATLAFGNMYDKEEINRVLNLFMRRFFQNQFKRSCLPDGPKIGSVSLSPRSDFQMPSDACSDLWLK